MMPINRWWDDRPGEIYWLETTDRDDLGVDLNAPRVGEEGQYVWSYALVGEVEEDDIIIHYRARPHNAITAWSRAVGAPYNDDVYWGAHGMASGRGPVAPYWRPGIRIGLDGPYPLSEPVNLDRLRAASSEIQLVQGEIQASVSGSVYLPFALSAKRELRPSQSYLTKMPQALLLAVPELATIVHSAEQTAPAPDRPAPRARQAGLGRDYENENEEWETTEREPFSVDPDVVDRGRRGHKRTQNALAQHLRTRGFAPKRSIAGEPQFDLAWEDADAIVVAEIKSKTRRNEEKQLRLGLGQVLRYAHQLEAKGRPVRPVLVLEARPSDNTWGELCGRLNVVLTWPEEFVDSI